jgi:hypothetical protein
MALQTSILIAAIPWAFSVNSSVKTVEAKLEFLSPISQLLERVTRLEMEIQALKGGSDETKDDLLP